MFKDEGFFLPVPPKPGVQLPPRPRFFPGAPAFKGQGKKKGFFLINPYKKGKKKHKNGFLIFKEKNLGIFKGGF